MVQSYVVVQIVVLHPKRIEDFVVATRLTDLMYLGPHVRVEIVIHQDLLVGDLTDLVVDQTEPAVQLKNRYLALNLVELEPLVTGLMQIDGRHQLHALGILSLPTKRAPPLGRHDRRRHAAFFRTLTAQDEKSSR